MLKETSLDYNESQDSLDEDVLKLNLNVIEAKEERRNTEYQPK